jgi:hypothetical protein
LRVGISAFLLLCTQLSAVDITSELLDAIEFVESRYNPNAVGDNGVSVGSFQITKAYVDDVNRLYHRQYTYNDRYDRRKSRNMTILYLSYYGNLYEKRTGNRATYEVLCRIHNGGPTGMYKLKTKQYWKKVERRLLCRRLNTQKLQ